jgi:hypothetical protein
MRYLLSFLAFVILNCLQIQSNELSEIDLKSLDFTTSIARERDPNNNVPEDSPSIVNIEGEPSAIVNNCVNAITGDFLDFRTDMVVPGAQPIVMHRTYSSSMNSTWGGWTFNHDAALRVRNAKTQKGQYRLLIDSYEGSGVLLRYEGWNYVGELAKLFSLRGLSNSGNREISGRTNRKNSVFKLGKDSLVLHTGSGEKRHYERGDDAVLHIKFYLTRDEMANGNQITYSESKDKSRRIVAKNSASKQLAYVTQSGSEEKAAPVVMKSCDGRRSTYRLAKHHDRIYLISAVHSHGPAQKYSYAPSERDDKHRLLIRKALPDNRQTLISYYNKDENQVLNQKITLKKDDPQIDRVKFLKAPVGTTATPVVTHAFLYNIKRDKDDRLLPSYTTVYDALKRKSHEYYYDKNCSLKRVVKFVKGKKYRQDRLFWGSGNDYTNLISRVMEADDEILFCRHLDYDERGNIRVEQLWGNLTGRNESPLKINSQGKPNRNGCEFYKKNFKYSDKEFNLPIYEDNGRTIITTSYKKKTELVTERFIRDQERILQRQFYQYDRNAVLIKEIRDDGSSENKNSLTDVTERHITYITPRKTTPIGLPEIIEEK